MVVSRGLIDVVPDEATLASMLAHELADAMLPKPYQDQYGFSDILRLPPTKVLKQLSFQEEKADSEENSERAMELLKKLPYASNLGNALVAARQDAFRSNAFGSVLNARCGNIGYA